MMPKTSTKPTKKDVTGNRKSNRREPNAKCLHCSKRHGDAAPFWNAGKQGWSVSFWVVKDGKRVQRNRLIAKGWDGHDEAMRIWFLAGQDGIASCGLKEEEAKPVILPADAEVITAEEICDRYMVALRAESKVKAKSMEKTVDTANADLKSFCSKFGDETVGSLRKGGAARIMQWCHEHQTWGPSTIESICKRIRAAFNFAAHDLEIISTSPLSKLNTGKKRVAGSARMSIFTAAQVDTIFAELAKLRGAESTTKAFKMLLGTGCRPQEFCDMKASDVRKDEHGNLVIYVDHKNQHKPKWGGRQRPIRILSPELDKIVLQAMEDNPSGALFRNSWNLPWSVGSLLQALMRVTEKPACVALGLNVKEKHSKGSDARLFSSYTWRHTFAHRMVTGFYGVELSYAAIAELMGNSSELVEKTYAKLSKGMPDIVAKFKVVR